MTGDELITYGFKRVIESIEKQTAVLEKIEQHLFTQNNLVIASEADLNVIRSFAEATEVAVLDMKRLIAEGQHDGTRLQ